MSTATQIDKQTGTEITIDYEVVSEGKPAIVFRHSNGNRIEDGVR